MKKILLLFTINSFFLFSNAAAPVETASDINDVTVFLNGAQITRSAKVDLKPGLSEIEFTQISRSVKNESLQIKSDKNVEIVDVKFKSKKRSRKDAIDELSFNVKQKITDQQNLIKSNEKEQQSLKEEIRILTKQKSYLHDIKLSGKHNLENESKSKLQELLPYYTKEYKTLSGIIYNLKEDQKKIAKTLEKENKVLDKLYKKHNINSAEFTLFTSIHVLVNSQHSGETNFQLKYLVNNAYWKPIYDVYASNIYEPIQLNYKAKIIQNTGINWNNVTLNVSSSNPSQSKERPILKPSYVNIAENRNGYSKKGSKIQNDNIYSQNSYSVSKDEMKIDYEAYDGKNASTYSQTEINLNYQLKRKYNIKADNQAHFVNLKKEDVKTDFVYHTVPKLDCNAYLVGKIKNWNQLNLISGEASLFFEGTYIGKSYINTGLLEDLLILSFGPDERINVKRTKLDTKSNSSFFDSKKTDVYNYDIEVQNNNNQDITIEILDQYPLSNNGEIEVSLNESDKAEVNEKLGSLLWKIDLAPNENKSVQFGFSVRYPKDHELNF